MCRTDDTLPVGLKVGLEHNPEKNEPETNALFYLTDEEKTAKCQMIETLWRQLARKD